MIGLGCNDPHKAAVLARLDGQGATDGGEGEDGLDDVVTAFDILRADACGDDLGCGMSGLSAT